uniref:Putative secreted protein n=1 Tax=Corethrella appendiculata TaxID=1370023 RepID=U5ENR1_9DIPT
MAQFKIIYLTIAVVLFFCSVTNGMPHHETTTASSVHAMNKRSAQQMPQMPPMPQPPSGLPSPPGMPQGLVSNRFVRQAPPHEDHEKKPSVDQVSKLIYSNLI